MTLPSAQDSLALARAVITAAAEKKAENILLLDLRNLSSVADYFVLCSGASERQLRAIAEGIEEHVYKERHLDAHHIEGLSGGGWILLDYHDVVVHIFLPSQRSYYNLEGLWAKAPVLLRMQ
jgi:ribosome-associated protein